MHVQTFVWEEEERRAIKNRDTDVIREITL